MPLTTLDWVLLGVLALSMVLGAWRGLVHEVLSVLGWIAAFVLAQLFAQPVGQWLPMDGMAGAVRYAAGFVVVFITTVFAAGLLIWLVKKMMENVGLRPVDRVLGAAFGVVRGVIILLAVSTLVMMTPLKQGQWWQASVGAGALSTLLKGLKPVLPSQFGQYIQAARAQALSAKG